jgi:hypothetical protein
LDGSWRVLSTETRLKSCLTHTSVNAGRVGEVLRRNTLTQLRLFSTFDPSTLAMRQTFEEVLRVPAINRYFADEVSGFGVAYPEPRAGWQLGAPGWREWATPSGQGTRAARRLADHALSPA